MLTGQIFVLYSQAFEQKGFLLVCVLAIDFLNTWFFAMAEKVLALCKGLSKIPAIVLFVGHFSQAGLHIFCNN